MTEGASGARPVPFAWSAGVGAAALLAYLWLAPAVPGAGDSGEFALVLALNGVAHPTGYPLYTLFGHPFVVALHGLGRGGVSWVVAANAWSAIGGGVAIALMHAFAARWIAPGAPLSRRARAVLALLPVSLFAFNPAWTAETTVAEVHAWHVAWVMGAALAFLGLARADAEGGAWAKRLGPAAAWGFLCGVGLAHHATAVLVAFPLSLALIAGRARTRTLTWAATAVAAAAALVPLSSYGLIYLKALHPGLAVWAHLEPTWPSWLAHVTGAQYGGFLGRFHPSPLQAKSLAPYVYPFVFPWLPLLVLVVLRARSRAERLIGLGLCGAVALQILFVLGYGVPDPSSYFLPAMAINLCAMAPLGAGLALEGLRTRRLALLAGAALAVLALALAGPWIEAGRFRRLGLTALERRVRDTWASVPFERGAVLWGDDMFHRLHAYQLLDGEKPGVLVVNPVELIGGPARSRFIAQRGFDPLEGVTVPAALATRPDPEGAEFQRFLVEVGRRIEAGTSLPVARFDLRRRTAFLIDQAAPRTGVAPRP